MEFFTLMSRKLIAQKIGYPVYDLYIGNNTLKILNFLKKTQWWDSDKINRLQLLKLKLLVNHSYKNVPYYHFLFKRKNIKPNDIKTIEDIKKIPILTKEIVKSQGSQMISKIHDKKTLIYSRTGGTTGQPLRVIKDNRVKSWVWASFYRFFNWMNFELGDPRVTIWGQRIVSRQDKTQIIRKIQNWLKNEYFIDAFKISSIDLLNYIKKFEKIKPVNIHGYCSAIYNFALMIEKLNINLIRPKAISTTAEVLHDFHRQKFEKIFGCKTFDQYGSGETNAIAFECNEHKGLHINSEHVIVELLKEKSKNNFGQVLITDLDNYAMPFLRYQNGDLCTLSDKKCSCGREFSLIKAIQGRIGDTIYSPSGAIIHPEFFTHLLNETNFYEKYNVVKYQVVQESMNKLVWNFVLDQDLKIQDKKLLSRYIRKYLPKMQVDFKILDNILNENSGKFKYVKSKIH